MPPFSEHSPTQCWEARNPSKTCSMVEANVFFSIHRDLEPVHYE
uniref:Uncharacterized protein n=1 Tax=Rhizophora mucronata TaxID=61149 RepID=A0A2P2KB74_RHIMU